MRITVDIPDRDWARLVGVAEERGVKLPELVYAAVLDLMPWRDTIADQVQHLARAGFPDARIAERLGVNNAQVSALRREAGIPANRFTRGEGRNPGRKTA